MPSAGFLPPAEVIGQALRRLRKQRRLEVRALAERLGIQPTELVAFERGHQRIGFDLLVRLLSELGASLADLPSAAPKSCNPPRETGEPTMAGGPLDPAPPRQGQKAVGGLAWRPLSLL